MPKVKVDHIVSCSSEDSVHVANNILNNDMTKKWKSQNAGEGSVSIILQLEKATKISGIDIGNEHSAFVEVLVGRSSSQDKDFKPILNMSSFMTPMEAKNSTNCNRVRIFQYSDLIVDTRDEKWDRVKVICTQMFNKNVQYGLSFITLNCPQEAQKEELVPVSLGKFKLRPPSPDVLTAGSIFAHRKEFVEESTKEEMKKESSKEWLNKFGTPKCQATKIQPSTSGSSRKASNTSVTEKKRGIDLFYDSDDDKPHDKIDKVVAKKKAEDEAKKNIDENKETPKGKQKEKKDVSFKKDDDKTSKQKKTSKAEKDNDNDNASPGTSKRKIDRTPNKTIKKIKLVTKPFDQLMSGIVFTISGIVNPERANLRELALKMGAKYKPNWDDSCTHLVCAFANTPKFKEVQGQGKIVTKSWIPDCHSQRKRLPWRRYALDRNDKGKSESEDEICEQNDETKKVEVSRVPQISNDLSGDDTEDEIDKILKKQNEDKKTSNGNVSDSFNMDTDEELLERRSKAIIQTVPKLFESEMFFIDNVFSETEKLKLERLIKAVNGYILDKPNNLVDYVITDKDSVESMQDKFPDAKLVSPLWIYELHDMQQLVPCEKYLLT